MKQKRHYVIVGTWAVLLFILALNGSFDNLTIFGSALLFAPIAYLFFREFTSTDPLMGISVFVAFHTMASIMLIFFDLIPLIVTVSTIGLLVSWAIKLLDGKTSLNL